VMLYIAAFAGKEVMKSTGVANGVPSSEGEGVPRA